jgi:hypothetical protein
MSGDPPTTALALPRFLRERWPWVVLAVVMLAVAAIRIRLLDMPLERDEGEYAYTGQLILDGIPPYQLAYSMKFPGTHLAYAMIMQLFGQTPAGIHFGLLLVNAATSGLVFLLARRLLDDVAGVAAGASHAVLSLSPGVMGLAGHASHFVVLPAVAGVLLQLRAMRRGQRWLWFASGVAYGVAVLMKQPGLLFGLFGLAHLFWTHWRSGPANGRAVFTTAAWLVGGMATPFLLMCFVLLETGVFVQFVLWTMAYAREYAAMVPLADAPEIFLGHLKNAAGPNWQLWLLAAAGAVAAGRHPALRGWRSLVAGFFAASLLAVCPGLYFRDHYFILLLPAVSLLAGVAMSAAQQAVDGKPASWKNAPLAGFLLAVVWVILQQSTLLLTLSPERVVRTMYRFNPFPEAVAVGRYLREHASPQARIAVIGSEPEIYFYARRPSATGHIYTYALMEPQRYARRMQEQMIGEIEAARPEYMVYVSARTSWMVRTNSEPLVFEWYGQYTRAFYEPAGVLDIVSLDHTEAVWGRDAWDYLPRSQYYLLVLKRRDVSTAR